MADKRLLFDKAAVIAETINKYSLVGKRVWQILRHMYERHVHEVGDTSPPPKSVES
jgi:hypothetical protein